MSVACFSAKACGKSGSISGMGSASRSTVLYPEWQPSLKTTTFDQSRVEFATSLASRWVEKSAASALKALKCAPRNTTSWRALKSFARNWSAVQAPPATVGGPLDWMRVSVGWVVPAVSWPAIAVAASAKKS